MLQEIESMARHSDAAVLECSHKIPPADIREQLSLSNDQKALHLRRVRHRDGHPFGYYCSWTAGLTKQLDASQFTKTPRLELFRKQGMHITHATQALSAKAADIEIANALEIPVGSPILTLSRRSYNGDKDNEQLVDGLSIFYNSEHFQYQVDLKAQ